MMINYQYRFELRDPSGRVLTSDTGTIWAWSRVNARARVSLQKQSQLIAGVEIYFPEMKEIDRRKYWVR